MRASTSSLWRVPLLLPRRRPPPQVLPKRKLRLELLLGPLGESPQCPVARLVRRRPERRQAAPRSPLTLGYRRFTMGSAKWETGTPCYGASSQQ